MKIEVAKDQTPIYEEEWGQCREYLQSMFSHIKKALCELEEERIEASDHVVDELFLEIMEGYDARHEDFVRFEVFLLNSFFSYSYFLFERALLEMCERSKTNRGSSTSFKAVRGRDTLKLVKNYMKGFGITFPPCGGKDREWSDIQIYNKIRNAIAHNGAIIPSSKDMKSVLPYAKRKRILAGTDTNPRLELTRPFCEEAIDTFHHFLRRVWEADPKPTVTAPTPIREIPATGTDSHSA